MDTGVQVIPESAGHKEPVQDNVLSSPATPAIMDDTLLAESYQTAIDWLSEHGRGDIDREDVAQEAVLSAWLGYAQFIGTKQDYEKWFGTILRHKVIDAWRKDRRRKTLHYSDLSPIEIMFSPDGSVEYPITYRSDALPMVDDSTSHIEEFVTTREVIKNAIEVALENLPLAREALDVLYARRWLGLSHQEIANEQDIELVACKCRLFRLRKYLTKLVLDSENET